MPSPGGAAKKQLLLAYCFKEHFKKLAIHTFTLKTKKHTGNEHTLASSDLISLSPKSMQHFSLLSPPLFTLQITLMASACLSVCTKCVFVCAHCEHKGEREQSAFVQVTACERGIPELYFCLNSNTHTAIGSLY